MFSTLTNVLSNAHLFILQPLIKPLGVSIHSFSQAILCTEIIWYYPKKFLYVGMDKVLSTKIDPKMKKALENLSEN